ncbi:MAG: hypothetical protein WCK14_07850 [Actinomycetota bacterium]|jgi:hypothetical protein
MDRRTARITGLATAASITTAAFAFVSLGGMNTLGLGSATAVQSAAADAAIVAPPAAAAPVVTTTTAPAPTTTVPQPVVPIDWPVDRPLPPLPEACAVPRLDLSGVWNCNP